MGSNTGYLFKSFLLYYSFLFKLCLIGKSICLFRMTGILDKNWEFVHFYFQFRLKAVFLQKIPRKKFRTYLGYNSTACSDSFGGNHSTSCWWSTSVIGQSGKYGRWRIRSCQFSSSRRIGDSNPANSDGVLSLWFKTASTKLNIRPGIDL